MGRGIAYQYEYFKLFDDSPDLSEERYKDDIAEGIVEDSTSYEQWYQGQCSSCDWEEERQNIRDICVGILDEISPKKARKRGGAFKPQWTDRHAYCFADSHDLRFSVGIDAAGDGPCIFLKPYTYDHPLTGEEKEYDIWRDAQRFFFKLSKLVCLRSPTSAWTSVPYEPETMFPKRKDGKK